MLTFDFREFEQAAFNMNAAADQVPFALARAMNDALSTARNEIITQTWPSHVQMRNKQFIGAALKREFATKGKLSASIVESGAAAGKGNLTLHDKGGTRRPIGNKLAIPSVDLKGRRTGKGVPVGMRPRNAPNTFLKGDVIYERIGSYHKKGSEISRRKGTFRDKGADGRTLKLLYVLKPSTPINADVPFQEDFDRVMSREIVKNFGPRMMDAMATRRRK